MYVIDLVAHRKPTERYELEGDHFVGRSRLITITIVADSIARRHARLRETPDGVVVEDMGSANGTYVNGVMVQTAILTPNDVVDFPNSGHSLRLVGEGVPLIARFRGRSAEEDAMLARIAAAPYDEEARQIYGDWLAEHGYASEAEAIALERAGKAHRTEAAATHHAWRALVMRPPVENCKELRCPRSWGALAMTSDDAVRVCGTCTHDVHFALSEASANRRIAKGRPIVYDPALPRA